MGNTASYSLPYPEGTSPVVVHTDVRKLADAVDEKLKTTNDRVDTNEVTIEDARYYKGRANAASSPAFDELPTALRDIWSADDAAYFGLPELTQGSLNIHRWGTAGGVAEYTTRSSPPRVWETARLSGGWVDWVRTDAGAVSASGMKRLMTAPAASLKAAAVALTTGYGGERISGSGTTAVIQHMPAEGRTVQVNIRNWNPRYTNDDREAVTLSMVRIGLHTGNGNGTEWINLRSGTTGYVAQTVTVPNSWRGQEFVVEYTWSGTDVTLALGTGWTNGVRATFPPLFVWVGIQVPASVPIIAAYGSSTAAGVGAGRPLIDSWLALLARSLGAVPMFWANSGDSASSWVLDADRKWELYGLDVAAPDAMIYAMLSNDRSGGAALAEMQGLAALTVQEIRSRITTPIYGTTITPRNPLPADDAQRVQFNNWMPTSGLFQGVFDFSGALSLPDGSLNPAYDADGTHPNDAGHERLKAAVDRPIIAPPAGLNFDTDGVPYF